MFGTLYSLPEKKTAEFDVLETDRIKQSKSSNAQLRSQGLLLI